MNKGDWIKEQLSEVKRDIASWTEEQRNTMRREVGTYTCKSNSQKEQSSSRRSKHNR